MSIALKYITGLLGKHWKIIAIVLLGLAVWMMFNRIAHLKKENSRLDSNQESLLSEAQYWKLKDGSNAAAIGALSLTVQELKHAQDSQMMALKGTIEKLGVRLKDVKNASSVNFETETRINTFLKDSTVYDSVPIKVFHGSTRFNEVHLTVWPTHRDSLELRVVTRDKMTQVVYRLPRGWKFWKGTWWEKRKLRQVVNFENPDTRIEYPRYIEIKRNNKK